MKIYTDGAATMTKSGDTYLRGKGGAAMVVTFEDTILFQDSVHFDETTNNHCELYAILMALKFAQARSISSVEICSDSAYCINMLKPGGWVYSWVKNGWTRGKKHEPIENLELIKKIYNLLQSIDVTFTKVLGHAGNEFNELADKLAVQAKEGHIVIHDDMVLLTNIYKKI